MEITTIERIAPGRIRVLDQTALPGEERYLELTTVAQVADAIKRLVVRGAPLIGISAAYGLVLAAESDGADLAQIEGAAGQLAATRPTAVNLNWALDRMLAVARNASGGDLAEALRLEAEAIHREDREMCLAIGEAGLPLLPDGSTVMTVCNAGALATGGIGTALAPVYRAHEAGRRVSVLAPETRPLLQGARLTAWELGRSGVPVTVLTDGMVASRAAKGDITCAIVGADRIASNGDTANKIGTYALALAARAHGIPLYVAAPSSTYDPRTPDGSGIPIEERAPTEVNRVGDSLLAPEGAAVWNPAFDVTPAEFIAGYLTDVGHLEAAQLRDALSPGAAPRG